MYLTQTTQKKIMMILQIIQERNNTPLTKIDNIYQQRTLQISIKKKTNERKYFIR